MGFYLDAVSLLMILVVTLVGLLIHVYSTAFMRDDEGYSRFFAYMNLFVASMLMLVLADNLICLYLGWEGVGLCSYLLIGFWYEDPHNGRAARKAFLVTRVGDAAMAVGLFLLFRQLGTLNIQELMRRAHRSNGPWARRSAVAAAALLLAGAMGKSAQLPLQTWLPDAMAGPTPVSALIHAATMVTAGVYLIARMHVLFALAPAVQMAVAVIGAAHAAAGRLQCPGAARHQAGAGLFHDQPDRLHVSGPGRGCLVSRYVSLHDPCLFQGAAVSGSGCCHSRAGWRARYVQAWADCEGRCR